MSRSRSSTLPRLWPVRTRWRRAIRVAAVMIGLGLGTAGAAEAVRLAVPEGAITDAAVADDVAMSSWRVFDPGFLVDHLPFKMTVGQTISYSDNVQNTGLDIPVLATDNRLVRLPSRGDFYSDTTISAAGRFPMGAQTFFLNGTYAPRRYFTDTQLDADNYSVNGGVDYNVADRCSGRLIGGTASDQSPQAETAGFGVETTRTDSFNETARCRITGTVFGLLNSGVSHLENTGGVGVGAAVLSFALNNYDQHYVGGGLEYDLTGLDRFKATSTYTDRNFTNRPAASGLASNTQQVDLRFDYDRTFSSKLDASASGGLSMFTIPGSTGDFSEPVYSVSLNYRPTPKIVVSASEARSAGAPQSVIADISISDTQQVSLSYRYSPKLNLSGILSRTDQHNVGLGNTFQGQSTLPQIFANSINNNASVVATYTVSPLVTATASYTYTERTDTSRPSFDAVSNVFRVGLFYTR